MLNTSYIIKYCSCSCKVKREGSTCCLVTSFTLKNIYSVSLRREVDVCLLFHLNWCQFDFAGNVSDYWIPACYRALKERTLTLDIAVVIFQPVSPLPSVMLLHSGCLINTTKTYDLLYEQKRERRMTERRNVISNDAIDVGDNHKKGKLQKTGPNGHVH